MVPMCCTDASQWCCIKWPHGAAPNGSLDLHQMGFWACQKRPHGECTSAPVVRRGALHYGGPWCISNLASALKPNENHTWTPHGALHCGGPWCNPVSAPRPLLGMHYGPVWCTTKRPHGASPKAPMVHLHQPAKVHAPKCTVPTCHLASQIM